MKRAKILEVHRTELGNIYLERDASVLQTLVWRVKKVGWWFASLLPIEVDDRWDSEKNNGS